MKCSLLEALKVFGIMPGDFSVQANDMIPGHRSDCTPQRRAGIGIHLDSDFEIDRWMRVISMQYEAGHDFFGVQ